MTKRRETTSAKRALSKRARQELPPFLNGSGEEVTLAKEAGK